MSSISEIIKKKLIRQPLVYVTRDIERALGMEPSGGYFIVSNNTEYGREIKKKYRDNVWLINSEKLLDTHELLLQPEVEEIISKHSAQLLVFQNNSRIERLCKEKNWNLLNSSAEISKIVEEKISQVKWLGELSKFLPKHNIKKLKDVVWVGEKFILQFNHAHTGEGTFIIDSKEVLEKLTGNFPERESRITDFIDGPVFTVNVVVGKDTYVGNISYQITGLKPFTEKPFSTIGNDWKLPYKILKKEEAKEIEDMARAIGARLQKDSWRGLFGIDVIQDSETRKIYLLEINARQPASTTFESLLQKQTNLTGLTTFEAHLLSLLKLQATSYKLQAVSSGAQIILRNNKTYSSLLQKTRIAEMVKRLEEKNFTVIPYKNTGDNKELLRIQTKGSLVESHGKLSAEGEIIRDIIQYYPPAERAGILA